MNEVERLLRELIEANKKSQPQPPRSIVYGETIEPPWEVQVAQGKLLGWSHIHKFGRNSDIDMASGFEALWGGGGDYTGFNAVVAETIEVFTTGAGAANNVPGGSGAWNVELFGLDANLLEQSELVTLNGTTPVNTRRQYLRMDRGIVRKAGTTGINGANDGTITARQNVTTANIFMVIQDGRNQTTIAAYTIPANKEGSMLAWFAALSKKQAAFSEVQLLFRPPGEPFQVKEEQTISSAASSNWDRPFPVPKDSIAGGTDIKIMADTSADDMGVAGGFDILMEEVL